jgi:hypothetical protein
MPPTKQIVEVSNGTENEGEEAARKMASRRRIKKIVMIVVFAIGISLVVYSIKDKFKPEKQEVARSGSASTIGRMLGFGKSGDPIPATKQQEEAEFDFGETEDSMLKLAKRAKAAGLKLQGRTQCIWTKHQREMFGKRDSEARKVLESMYIECQTRDMCPNVRGYPTWGYNDKQFPGFKPPEVLRQLIKDVETIMPRAMIQGASEPIDEANIPDAIHSVKAAETKMTPEDIKKMMIQVMKEAEENKKGSDAAMAEANREISDDKSGGDRDEKYEKLGGSQPNTTGGSAGGTSCTKHKKIRKENVRGVSNYPPLNVPDMPGTEPLVLDLQHSDNQTRQGNIPRASAENHAGTAGVAQQVVSAFNHAQHHNQTRSETGDTFSTTKYPHTIDITTGEAFSDKRIVVPKNS